ncbi:MAG TPA: hypothetical protein VM734_03500 [Kofleriaceae bacterium]|nr:hypothetical protein [Kofleriaceae bacterium]
MREVPARRQRRRQRSAEVSAPAATRCAPSDSLLRNDRAKPAEPGFRTAIAHGAHADGPRPISPLVILVQDGEPCGVILPVGQPDDDAPPPPPKKRGLFARLFGRN